MRYSGDGDFKYPDKNGVKQQHWVMYYSVYISTLPSREGGKGQACIGRATARNVGFDPAAVGRSGSL